jgi:hypothetical protein
VEFSRIQIAYCTVANLAARWKVRADGQSWLS